MNKKKNKWKILSYIISAITIIISMVVGSYLLLVLGFAFMVSSWISECEEEDEE